MPEKRNYHLKVHGMKPKEITIDGIKLIEMENNKELEKGEMAGILPRAKTLPI